MKTLSLIYKERKEDQHITLECVGEKRRQEDNYDSRFSLKIPKLDYQGPVPLSSHGLSNPDFGDVQLDQKTYEKFWRCTTCSENV